METVVYERIINLPLFRVFMFVHNLEPVLFSLGPFEIRYYGLVYLIGALLVYLVLRKYKEELKVKVEDIDNFLLYTIILMLVFARLFHILFWGDGYYLANPGEILKIWKGGISFHGGLVGIIIAAVYFTRKHKVSLLRFADLLTLPFLFTHGLGRIANFVNAEIVGTITSVPWCVEFPFFEGCRHPVQLYAAVGRFALFGLLLYLFKKKQKDGLIFWLFLLLTGIGRFLLDFIRTDARFLGLSNGQYLSIVLVLVSSYYLHKLYYKKRVLSIEKE